MQTYHVAYTRIDRGGTEYSYGEIKTASIINLRKRLISEGLPDKAMVFIIYEPGYRIVGTLTNRQMAYPGIWLWSVNGEWKTVNPETGRLGAEMTDWKYKRIMAKARRY